MSVWNEAFYKEGGGSEDPIFRVPQTDLPQFIRLLKEQHGKSVLDLGCGTGRHVIALAKEGFTVYGLDIAEQAVERTKEWLAEERLSADVRVGEMYRTLPYQDNFFDGVISIKAMHHGMMADIKRLVGELERTMRPGGILMVEVPKKDPERRAKGPYAEVEPGTIVFPEGPEKDVPHHIFENEEELKTLFENFDVLDIRQTGKDQRGTPSAHFTMFARLKP